MADTRGNLFDIGASVKFLADMGVALRIGEWLQAKRLRCGASL